MQAHVGLAPRTDDERWRALLAHMAVPSQRGVYVLGCFARHVTFRSQQVRALSLIDALCNTGTLREGASIGVVGAGLAGLSAAAAALARGLRVYLFEKSADPRDAPGQMPLQSNSDERWVDPFIYDWPLNASDSTGPAAQLPLLDWTAQTATAVRDLVLASFEELVQKEQKRRGPDCIGFHKCNVREDMIRRSGDGQLLLDIDAAVPPITLNGLILAVGFGVEEPAHTRARYWTNDGLGGNQADGKRYLVSGMGDGGLTDVMRLCIADFKHRDVIAAFRDSESVGVKLEEAVRERRQDLCDVFLEEAKKIEASAGGRMLARRETEVYLAGSPERLFGPQAKASILNRLILAWLFIDGRFKLIDARVRTPVRSAGGRCVADFMAWDSNDALAQPTTWHVEDGKPVKTNEALPADFDDVVIRHGPGRADAASGSLQRPIQEHFPGFWAASEKAREYWNTMPHWDDWTRRPDWDAAAFTGALPLDTASPAGKLYAVVEHPETKRFVERAARTAMTLVHKTAGVAGPAPAFIALDMARDCETPQRFGRVVRTLCRADVAVFDLTELRPEVLVLLGIRAVARRGITLVTARFTDPDHEPHESDSGFAVPLLPFLLQDTAVYGWGEESKFIERLKKAIEEGLHRAERLGAIYRDLPAYDEIRRLGPEPEDYRPQGADDAVLFLAPFDAPYRTTKGSWLRGRVSVAASGRGIYIIESASPERTASKLYSAVRRTQLCIIDWTDRRPNVFFEFGVRLAASPKPPVCVIHCTDEWAAPAAGNEPIGGILKLYRPLVYNHEATVKEDEAFEAALVERRTALDSANAGAQWPLNGAALSPDFVYREVRAATPIESEDWIAPVWAELRRSAELVIGSKPVKYPDPPVLFGDNVEYARRAAQSAVDRLLAAWYFLDRRYGLKRKLDEGSEIQPDVDPAQSWVAIGNLIVRQLKYDDRAEYVGMREEIDNACKRVRQRR